MIIIERIIQTQIPADIYAADKGIDSSPIRGYREEDGHDTNKIMRVLNAFYQYMTEKDGKEPMPMEVFKAITA